MLVYCYACHATTWKCFALIVLPGAVSGRAGSRKTKVDGRSRLLQGAKVVRGKLDTGRRNHAYTQLTSCAEIVRLCVLCTNSDSSRSQVNCFTGRK